MRIAALDIGSRSFSVLVATLEHQALKDRQSQKELVRLGEGLPPGSEIPEERFQRAAGALHTLKHFAKESGARLLLPYGTHAIRQAPNADEFLRSMRALAEIEIGVLSSAEEARLTALSVLHLLPKRLPSCVVDIGGGSVELSLVSAGVVRKTFSLPLGVQSLALRYPAPGGLSAAAQRSLLQDLQASLEGVASAARERGVRKLFFTGGTPKALLRSQAKSDANLLSFSWLCAQQTLLCGLSPKARVSLASASSERADTIHMGAALMRAVMEALHLDSAMVCSAGLREGILLDYQARFGKALLFGSRL